MRIRMLLAAARMIAFAYPGCAGGAGQGSTHMEPVAVTVLEPSPARRRAAHVPGEETSQSAATASHAAPVAARTVSDDALIKPLDNPYNVDGAPPIGPLPTYGAILLQRTADFDGWRTAFEESRAQRHQAGFVAQGLMRGIDDPQLVAVWLAVTDVEQARRYFADKTLRRRLQAAGALDAAEVRLSSNIAAKTEPGRTGLDAAILRVRVDDVAVFKRSFEAAEPEREAAGIVGYSLGQDVDNEHLLYVYLQSDDAVLLKAYLDAKQTKQSWRDAGVVGHARWVLVKEGELTLCR